MDLTFLNLTLLFAIAFTSIHAKENRLSFQFGSATVDFDVRTEVFSPKGLKVVIPHRDGLESLTFHGKINSSQDYDDEDIFAYDMVRNGPDQWILEDEAQMLKIGDTLHYWIFLQYKGSGQRFNDLMYKVMAQTPIIQSRFGNTDNLNTKEKEKKPKKKPNMSYNSHERTPKCICNEKNLKDIWTKMNETANKMNQLEENINPLMDRLNYLQQTIDELIRNKIIDAKLQLRGILPIHTNAVEDVRHVLIDKLGLIDLSDGILQAMYVNDYIEFTMKSAIDKMQILNRSRNILSNEKYEITEPNESYSTDTDDAFPTIEDDGSDTIQIDSRFDDPSQYRKPVVKSSVSITRNN